MSDEYAQLGKRKPLRFTDADKREVDLMNQLIESGEYITDDEWLSRLKALSEEANIGAGKGNGTRSETLWSI